MKKYKIVIISKNLPDFIYNSTIIPNIGEYVYRDNKIFTVQNKVVSVHEEILIHCRQETASQLTINYLQK